MQVSRKIKKDEPVATPAARNFFGNNQPSSFFGVPAGLQRQQAPALPQFSVNNFIKSFANFDAQYNVAGPEPATGTLFISHGVHMNYPKAMNKDERTTFENDFIKSVHEKWSNKHLLKLSEPGFSPYQCNVDVSARVEANPDDAQTVINVAKPKDLTALRPHSHVSAPFSKKGSKTTHTAKLDFRDPTIEKTNPVNNPDFIRDVGSFDFDSDKINAACKEDIDALVAFINAIPNPPNGECKFSALYTGRASSEGNKSYNKKLSERRMDAVSGILDAIPGFCLSLPVIAGEEGATTGPEFRKVTVGIIDETKNRNSKTNQNVAAHEFGHMIGLGDEYPNAEAGRFLQDKPRNYDLIKEVIDQDAADELLARETTSMMSAGNEVKRGHYIMFVAAIDVLTRPEIEQATGKKDAKWKVL